MNPNSSTRKSISIAARAKVNLALAVGPPRQGDGYHPISSWMARISLADEMLVTRLEDDRLSRYAILWHCDAPRTTPIDWSITKDLAVRAHHLLEREVDRTLPVQLKLEKRVPVGGGLGGGSADAAAMLLAVRELFLLDVSDDRLAELARELGSDVPFFLSPGPALVEGMGESIERTPAVTGDLVLIFPPFGCATGPVYKAFDADAPASLNDQPVRAMAHAGTIDPEALFNDLTIPATRVEPALEPLMDRVKELTERPVHMSGSGSTLFVVADSDLHADDLAKQLSSSLEGCSAVAVQIDG